MFYIREVGHVDPVCGGADSGGFDVVIRGLVQTEEEEFEAGGSVGDHVELVERVRGLPSEEDLRLAGLKSQEFGCDELIGSPCNRDVTGGHGNRVRVHRFGVPSREEKGGCPVAELSGPQEQ